MAALIEGLAGVKDGPKSQAYAHPLLSPRWDLTAAAPVKTIVRYAASMGYVAYTYAYNPAAREIQLTVTGSGDTIDCHFLLPTAPASTLTVQADGMAIAHQLSTTGPSHYVDFLLTTTSPQILRIHY
jgi:hypothetical protein